MKRTTGTFFISALLGFAVAVAAHEGRKHEGKPLEGEVRAVAGDRVTVQSGSSAVTVLLDGQTKLERGGQPAGKADLEPGQHVSVFGTRLGTGELAASEIILGGEHGAGKPGDTKGDMPMGHPH